MVGEIPRNVATFLHNMVEMFQKQTAWNHTARFWIAQRPMMLHRDVDAQIRIVVPRCKLRHANGFRIFHGEPIHRHFADVVPNAVLLHFVADD